MVGAKNLKVPVSAMLVINAIDRASWRRLLVMATLSWDKKTMYVRFVFSCAMTNMCFAANSNC